MTLSPIVFFAYNRPWHTEQTLNALQLNELASESVLYIYVDGPKENASAEQLKNIEKVREIVASKKWCKEVYLHISEHNINCRNSIIRGVSEVLKKYDSVIVLEDDIVTSPYFLRYMNLSLNHYKERKTVYSISAHTLTSDKVDLPKDYNYDVYVYPRPFNWGWGTWVDRWFQEDWDKSFIPNFLQRKNEVKAFNRAGEDLSKMLYEESVGMSDAWDVQFSYTHFVNHGVSIVPCHSYVKNIGLDGSGTHCNPISINNEVDLSLAPKSPILIDTLYVDDRIANAIYSYFLPIKRPLWQKVINRMGRFFGKKNIFVLKGKVYA